MKNLFRVKLAIVVLASCSTLVIAQQGNRDGDAFRGPVKAVRSEMTSIRVVGDSHNESTPVLIQEIVYSRDGLSRETKSYNHDGSIRQKRVETYRSNGTRATIRIVDGSDKTISTHTFETNEVGLPVSETRYNGDGSVKEKKFTQSDSSVGAVSTFAGDGRPLETSVAEVNSVSKTSTWRTTKPDGSRSEQIASKDSDGNHRTETLSYAADGSLTSKRVSIVDPAVTRLEATEFDGAGNVKRRSLEIREYDSRRNLVKIVTYRWNNELQKFQPSVANYHRITYFDTTER